MRIAFHGAAGGVTGSRFLVGWNGARWPVDGGLYQGGHEIAEEDDRPFGFDPTAIDFLLLTHAHLDHCGRIPWLVQRGLGGEIVATAASRDRARRIVDRARRVSPSGEAVPVRGAIHTLGALAAHAGCQRPAAWQRHAAAPLSYRF